MCRACSFCARGAGALETGSIDSAIHEDDVKKYEYNPITGHRDIALQRESIFSKVNQNRIENQKNQIKTGCETRNRM